MLFLGNTHTASVKFPQTDTDFICWRSGFPHPPPSLSLTPSPNPFLCVVLGSTTTCKRLNLDGNFPLTREGLYGILNGFPGLDEQERVVLYGGGGGRKQLLCAHYISDPTALQYVRVICRWPKASGVRSRYNGWRHRHLAIRT